MRAQSSSKTATRSDGQPELTGVPPDRPTVLVIQTAFLGDVVLTTPLLSVLAERFGPVDVITTPAAAGLLDNHPAVDNVLRYDKHGADRGWKAFRRLGSQLRARKYERVYLPHRSLRSGLLAFWSRAKERVGFADSPAAFSYTSRVPRPREGHEVERLLSLADVKPGGEIPPVSLGLAPTELAAADAWLLSHRIGSDFVAIAPGSVWATKRWPFYAQLAAELDVNTVIIGGPEDAPLADAIVFAAAGKAVNAAGALSLRGSAAVIQRAAALVTNDSAPLHLATAVGTPIIALFGPTVPEFGFGPRREGDIVLGHKDLPCRPCSKHGPPACPLGHHRCMRDLSIGVVKSALNRIIGSEESRAIRSRD